MLVAVLKSLLSRLGSQICPEAVFELKCMLKYVAISGLKVFPPYYYYSISLIIIIVFSFSDYIDRVTDDAAAGSSEGGCGRRVAPSTATKYSHALQRPCDVASLGRHYK